MPNTDVDINKAMAAAEAGADIDEAMRAEEIKAWSQQAASAAAAKEGITLTDAHWKVIEFLQKTYVEKGPASHARALAALLDEAFAAEGGAKALYQLFPGGPVAQGSRLAGVPVPHDSKDPSFGTSL